MKLNRALPILLALLTSQLSAAQAFAAACGPLFSSEYSLAGRIEVEPKIEAKEAVYVAAQFAEAVKKTNELLGDLVEPKEARVSVGDLFMFSVFDPRDFSIYVGLRPESMGKKHIIKNQHTLIHEYGHAILEKNLGERIPEYRTKNSASQEAEILHASLHEFFADAVTVVTTKNPKAIVEIVSDRTVATKNYSAEDLLMRNLAEGRHHLARQQWRKLIEKDEMRQDPYFILLPARWHLWQLVKTRIEGSLYQKQVLSRIFPQLVREVETLLSKPPAKVTVEEVEYLNQRLMNHLSEVL